MDGENAAEEIADALAAPIAEAQAQTEAAIETAEQIAAAAMEGERGREIQSIREGLSECRSTMEQLPLLMAEQFSLTLAAMRAEISAEIQAERANVLSAVVADLATRNAPEPPIVSTPPNSEPEVNPEDLTKEREQEPVLPVPKKRNRFL